MLVPELSVDCNIWLSKMDTYLINESYIRDGMERVARRFLIHLEKNGLTIHNVQPSDVTNYLDGLRRLRRSPLRPCLSEGQRSSHRSALHMFVVRGLRPPRRVPNGSASTANCSRDMTPGW